MMQNLEATEIVKFHDMHIKHSWESQDTKNMDTKIKLRKINYNTSETKGMSQLQ